MGIYGALSTAVTGLRAQSFALENISGNIANSQTTAYKRTDTAFADMVLGGDVNVRRQTAGSVQAFSRATNDLAGTLTGVYSATAIGVSGSGYLMVQDPTGFVDGRPTFGSGNLYTRRGDFNLDKNGFLVNGSGYYLMGNQLDPKTGNAIGSTPGVVQISKDAYPAEPSSTITYKANLPTTPQTANYVAADPSSWLLDAGVGATVTAADSDAFIASTIGGESVTLYDTTGTAYDAQFRWGKVANADPSATPPVNDSWALFYQSNTAATGTDVAWTRVDADPAVAGMTNYQFKDGALVVPSGMSTVIPDMTLNGMNLGDMNLSHGSGLTQYADKNGTLAPREVSQNGSASGDYVGVEVTDGGQVVASYTNGKTRPLYSIPIATFMAENQLAHVDGGAFAASAGSGDPLIGSGAGIVGQALEESNVDVADEFTKLIVTQQAYSANTRVVSTSNDMLQEALGMVR